MGGWERRRSRMGLQGGRDGRRLRCARAKHHVPSPAAVAARSTDAVAESVRSARGAPGRGVALRIRVVPRARDGGGISEPAYQYMHIYGIGYHI